MSVRTSIRRVALMKDLASTLNLLAHNNSLLAEVKRIALDNKFVVLLQL